ncbi:DUF3540 domain-containing protein [Enhygromyxa salina]|uniref:DUF3540 domain-containing protein n=1 Tax=Enhygromyxa salina TaxID=215803 RepID=A0A2S9YYT0_9BACT|nr:DUF3540 domain-containing protein [Enhygromyxa salina]PRQ10251.1 hypothetical protein ENSA7_00600 [Enhygromyxa salina]
MHAHDLELVRDSPHVAPRQGGATILARADEGFTLDDGERRFSARRAVSCLVEPELGDRVWFADEGLPGEHAYVLAVLERVATTPALLRVQGDAELRVDGRLKIAAREDLDLHSDARLGLNADELQVRARAARLIIDECAAVLRSLFTHVTKSTFVAKVIETLADRLSTHTKTSARTVEGLDQVQAGNLDYRAEHTVQIAATHAMVKGTDLVKVDGGQIHLG